MAALIKPSIVVGILEAGCPPVPLFQKYGNYGEQIERFLGRRDPTMVFKKFSTFDNQFPTSPADCDAWVISGSAYSANDDLPWVHRLKSFVVDIVAADRSIAGICFGHQLIASVMGGKVEKCPLGWGMGLQRYQLKGSHPGLMEDRTMLTLNAIHQDQVTVQPPDTTVFASSEFCPIAGLSYTAAKVISLQAHPEFSIDFEQDLLRLRRNNPLPAGQTDSALAELAHESASTDSDAVADWMTAFFRQHSSFRKNMEEG